jgi:hypothetical protein
MDRLAGRRHQHPVLWTAATVRKRSVRGESALAYMRRYLARMVVVLTLVTPLLVVLTYQWTPRRERLEADPSTSVVLASSSSSAGPSQPSSLHTVAFTDVTPEVSTGSAAGGSTSLTPLSARGQLDHAKPARPLAWYRVAADEEGVNPNLLEALHQVESSAAPDGCWPSIAGTGTIGPFQLQRSTFESHAVDGNGDGVIDICGFADSLFSAAAYLRSLGVDRDLDGPAVRGALIRYGTDPDRVIELARYYRTRDLAVTAESPVIH